MPKAKEDLGQSCVGASANGHIVNVIGFGDKRIAAPGKCAGKMRLEIESAILATSILF